MPPYNGKGVLYSGVWVLQEHEFASPLLHYLKNLFFLKILFVYLTEITSSREAGRERGREAGSPLSREPDVGLDPMTLRS